MLMIRRMWMAALLIPVVAGCAGVGSGGPSPGAGSALADQGRSTDEYRIGPEDMLRIDVWRNPDVSLTAPVRPDGKVSVPLIGDVTAGGRTPEQLASAIEKSLEYYIREPRVTVIVTELRSHEYLSRVRVTGAVNGPLSVPYRPGMTVLDVVLEAGGVTDFAAANRTKLYRTSGGRTQVHAIRLEDILLEGELETNYALTPGDIVSVPERLF